MIRSTTRRTAKFSHRSSRASMKGEVGRQLLAPFLDFY